MLDAVFLPIKLFVLTGAVWLQQNSVIRMDSDKVSAAR